MPRTFLCLPKNIVKVMKDLNNEIVLLLTMLIIHEDTNEIKHL